MGEVLTIFKRFSISCPCVITSKLRIPRSEQVPLTETGFPYNFADLVLKIVFWLSNSSTPEPLVKVIFLISLKDTVASLNQNLPHP